MKKTKIKLFILFVVTLHFTLCTLHLSQVQAASPTPTSKPTPTGSEARDKEILQKVQERIEQIKKRAFSGTLKEISNSTLIIENPKGEKRIKTDDQTKFFGSGKKEIKFGDLEIGNFIIALGTWQENGTLAGKRVTALAKAPKPAPARAAIYGRVADLSEEENVLSVTNPKNPTAAFEVKVIAETIITKKVEGKIKKVNFSAISVGDRVVVVGTKAKDSGTITAKLIHVIPGKATGLEKVSPTPGKVSPTPTPKKPTPTPTE